MNEMEAPNALDFAWSALVANSPWPPSLGDVMNCMTMSDTHELSTLNFIQNTKMRNLLASKKEGDKEKRASIIMEKQKQGKMARGKSMVAMKGIGQVSGEKKISSHHHQPKQSGWNNLVVAIDKRRRP